MFCALLLPSVFSAHRLYPPDLSWFSFSSLRPSCSPPLCYPQPSLSSCSPSRPAPLSAFLSQLLLFLPVPLGLSPFLVTLVPKVPVFSRSQQTWIVCPICTSPLSDPTGRCPIWTLLSSLQLVSGAQLCSLGHCSRGKESCPSTSLLLLHFIVFIVSSSLRISSTGHILCVLPSPLCTHIPKNHNTTR